MSDCRGRRPVGVVVVTFNSEAVVGDLLATLDRGMDGCDWSLVVVDNGSRDRSVEVVSERRPDATVIELGANPGYAAAVNRGVAAVAREADVLLMNPDLLLEPGCGANLARRLQTGAAGADEPNREADVGIVAPLLREPSGALSPSLRREPTIRRALAETFLGVRRAGTRGSGEAVLDPAAYEGPTAADWASGAALLVSRACLTACGPWDESLFLYSEDTEFALRARDRGYLTCLEPTAVATHVGGASRSDPSLWTRLVLNKLNLYRRRHGSVLAVGFRLVSLVRELRLALTGNRPSWAASRALMRGSDRR